jgi:hypothetical protein
MKTMHHSIKKVVHELNNFRQKDCRNVPGVVLSERRTPLGRIGTLGKPVSAAVDPSREPI